MMRFLASLLLFIMSTSIATGDGLKKIEILEGWKKSDGSIVYGLKISLKDGWKTYWHTPGPMGLKPQFDFEGSLNIGSLNVLWPSPKVFGSSGFESIGYENEVILPIKMQSKVDSDPLLARLRELGSEVWVDTGELEKAEEELQQCLKLIGLEA